MAALTAVYLVGSLPGNQASARSVRDDIVFTGMCSASGAIPLDAHLFAIADDEDDVIRIYNADAGGAPLGIRDLSRDLRRKKRVGKTGKKTKPRKHRRESDVEAAARLGDTAFWLTSHGRSESGKLRPERFRFFATTATPAGHLMSMIGLPYEGLLDDLISSRPLSACGVASSAQVPANEGGLNIEGMAARPDGGVLIGFRSPLKDRRAIIVPIDNPLALMHGSRARLGAPLLLDLGGAGVRELSWWHGSYWILAGGAATPSRLFSWSPTEDPRQVPSVSLEGLNPEAFFAPESRSEIMVLSDDGAVEIGGTACKRLKNDTLKRFRGRWIQLPGEML